MNFRMAAWVVSEIPERGRMIITWDNMMHIILQDLSVYLVLKYIEYIVLVEKTEKLKTGGFEQRRVFDLKLAPSSMSGPSRH